MKLTGRSAGVLKCAGAGTLVSALLFSPAIMAQTDASRVTPRDLRPETELPVPSLDQESLVDRPVTDLPEEVAELSVLLSDVIIRGGFPELAEATERFVAPFRDRRTTVDELYGLANVLEQLYNQQGYMFVRVTVPPQDVRDGGVVEFVVLDGYVADINLDAVPARQREAVRKRLQHLVNQPRLQANEVERAVILAGRTPGLALQSTLVPGTEPGSTVLVLEGDYTPLAGNYSADNRLSDDLGPWQSTLQLQANQLLGQGEQVYVYVSGDPDPSILLQGDSSRNVFGGGISWPLGTAGVSLNLEFSTSDTLMEYDSVWIPDTRSRFERATVRLGVPLKVTRTAEWSVDAIFEASRQVNDMSDFDYQLFRDELRVLRARLTSRHMLGQRSQVSSFVQISQGLRYGARSVNDAETSGIPFSRPGAKPDFTKVDMSVDWRYLLPAGFTLDTTFRAQHAFSTPLPSAELFGLDGDNAVSAVESGRLAADSGVTMRGEIGRATSLWNDRIWMTPYGYVAGGVPTNISGRTSAAGLGLRASLGLASVFLEYGHSHSEPSGANGSEFFARLQMIF